ncbi:hypothetical protein J6V85_03195 [Candidatus Saccharibacteria bacterium]|nr:hypothetical protein [Candidatus Saccharibacteria bacterium]
MRAWKGIIMPEDNTKTAPTTKPAAPSSPATNTPAPVSEPKPKPQPVLNNATIVPDVIDKINDAHNILIALSSDPSVDELSTAIGLSLFLDKLGKRATAIYSGATPNAIEFLKPEETFEPTVDALQDFVIALNKDKADHLRYKLDGDFVKIYITPYRTRISEEDLDFSYGDFNIDLVFALDVANGVDLDSALREHGRIMHDAVIINVTNGNPGKLGDLEWSDKKASSVSEMISKLIYSMNSKAKIEKEEATAFLTGIVAATNRFSNANTTPETMRVASKLMESGANQVLVSKNITASTENELFNTYTDATLEEKVEDQTKLDIAHSDEIPEEQLGVAGEEDDTKEPDLMDDLRAAEASLAQAGAEATPDNSNEPVKLEDVGSVETTPVDFEAAPEAVEEPAPVAEPVAAEPIAPAEPVAAVEPVAEVEPVTEAEPVAETEPTTETEPVAEPEPESESAAEPAPTTEAAPAPEPTPEPASSPAPEAEPTPTAKEDEVALGNNLPQNDFISDKPEKVLQPSSDNFQESLGVGASKYGQMLEEALASAPGPVQTSPMMANPAAMNAPAVPTNPEINGVPTMNYMPMPTDTVLAPPPTPPIDMSAPMPTPATTMAPVTPTVTPVAQAQTPLGAQPSIQGQAYAPQATDPGAFKIPGM